MHKLTGKQTRFCSAHLQPQGLIVSCISSFTAPQGLGSLCWVSTEEFTACSNAVLCESKQALTTPCKVSWKQRCETHLVSCPDSSALHTAPAINTDENPVGAATAVPRGGVATRVSVFHSPLPSLWVRRPLQLEEPRKGRRQIPKHRCLLPFYTLYLCLSSSNVQPQLALIHLHQTPATSHLSGFHSIRDNGLLVPQIRCSSIPSLPVCDQNFTLHSLSVKGRHPNDRGVAGTKHGIWWHNLHFSLPNSSRCFWVPTSMYVVILKPISEKQLH